MRLQFESSVEHIQEIKNSNHSFDSGILRVCYPGQNRNGSFISKESIERAVPSMYNCPVVCNYDLETDSIGGHDMELATDVDGNRRIVNLTEPVGVVPAGSNWWWETVNGKEYFTNEIILWKRSPAYTKIAHDGIIAHSMEIDVDNGKMQNGLFEITDFTFTAFCLLGDGHDPCFEDSALEVFDRDHARISFAQMMAEYKQLFTMSQPDQVVINQNYSEGGDEVLEQKIELLAKYGLTVEQFEADVNEMTYEELEAEMRKRFEDEPEDASGGDDQPGGDSGDDVPEDEPESDPEPTGGGLLGSPSLGANPPEEDDGDDDVARRNNYELAGQIRDELYEAISAEMVDGPWGPMPKYWMVDYDHELGEVYVEDSEDWKLYGFKYSMNGDAVVIDFESKTRKKYAIVDFDGGEQSVMPSVAFDLLNKLACAADEAIGQVKMATEKVDQMTEELGQLRQFKASIDNAEALAERNAILDQFEELNGIEEFEALREGCMELSVEDLEEKCFALRGKNMMKGNFSLNIGAPKVKIGKYEPVADEDADGYGGLFTKYGPNQD